MRSREVDHGGLAPAPFRWPGWAYLVVLVATVVACLAAWMIVSWLFPTWGMGVTAAEGSRRDDVQDGLVAIVGSGMAVATITSKLLHRRLARTQSTPHAELPHG
jgi:hypothetical protein